jgi:hypothetical protein
MPTTLFIAAGQVIEPSVSVPTVIVAKFAATAIAEPELDPQGEAETSYAFLLCPYKALQPLEALNERKFAHSLKLVLPKIIAPESLSCLTK